MTESRVYLQEAASGQMVEASLFDEISDEHLTLWEQDWVPAMQAFRPRALEPKFPKTLIGTGRRKSEFCVSC